MNFFSYDIEVADLEEEVRKGNHTIESVFGSKASPSVGERSVSHEPNRQHTISREAEARKHWRPKSAGDFTVEVKRTRSIERPHPKATRY